MGWGWVLTGISVLSQSGDTVREKVVLENIYAEAAELIVLNRNGPGAGFDNGT